MYSWIPEDPILSEGMCLQLRPYRASQIKISHFQKATSKNSSLSVEGSQRNFWVEDGRMEDRDNGTNKVITILLHENLSLECL